jgi:ADP-ribosylglycohydrolase
MSFLEVLSQWSSPKAAEHFRQACARDPTLPAQWLSEHFRAQNPSATTYHEVGTNVICQAFKHRHALDCMCAFSIVPAEKRMILQMEEQWRKVTSDPVCSRSIGCIFASILGDSMGHATEFQPVEYGAKMGQPPSYPIGRFQLHPGQWTDDSSMALCLMDSLLVCKGSLNELDTMIRYLAWTSLGYNNPFANDDARARGMFGRFSIGLGGNIGAAMSAFVETGEVVTKAGNSQTSGNGSVMRLAPIHVAFFDRPDVAMEMAARQSFVTHQGTEAAECCRLLAWICCHLISDTRSADRTVEDLRSRLVELCDSFATSRCTVDSVRSLAQSDPSSEWNWRSPEFKYAEARVQKQRGYVGAYAMDAVAMGLHLSYHAEDFADAMLRSAGQGGDADSVSAVVGQIVGSYWGHEKIPFSWMRTIQTWDNGTILPRVLALHNRRFEL